MRQLFKLIMIGFISGLLLMLVLKIVLELTGNTAYILLFNFDYIPIIRDLKPVWFFGQLFHYLTCIVSVISLFYILRIKNLQFSTPYYVIVYTIGGCGLFFLTALSDQPPAADDRLAWLYWTIAHGIFGYSVAFLIQLLMRKKID